MTFQVMGAWWLAAGAGSATVGAGSSNSLEVKVSAADDMVKMVFDWVRVDESEF
jgi:hypothetical protein